MFCLQWVLQIKILCYLVFSLSFQRFKWESTSAVVLITFNSKGIHLFSFILGVLQWRRALIRERDSYQGQVANFIIDRYTSDSGVHIKNIKNHFRFYDPIKYSVHIMRWIFHGKCMWVAWWYHGWFIDICQIQILRKSPRWAVKLQPSDYQWGSLTIELLRVWACKMALYHLKNMVSCNNAHFA